MGRRSKSIVAVALVVLYATLLGMCRTARSQELPSPEELLGRYEQTLSVLDGAEFHFQINVRFTRIDKATGTSQLEQESREEGVFRRLGRRYRVASRSSGRWLLQGERIKPELRGTWHSYESRTETATDGQRLVYVQRKTDLESGQENLHGVVAWREVPQREWLRYFRSRELSIVYGQMGRFGYLPDVLRRSSLSVAAGTLSGHPTLILTGKGEYGTLQIALDPEWNYLPRRIELVSQADDILFGNPVSAVPGRTEWRSVIDDVRLTRIGEIPVIEGFRSTDTSIYDDRIETYTAENTFSDIRLDLDLSSPEAFAIAGEIPDGTPVQVNDALPIEFVWQQGEIIKAVDHRLAQMKREAVKSGRSWRLIIMGVSALVLVVITAWVVLRQKRRIS